MAAKKAMGGSDDPDVINNNVYVLSETKIDLPFAETQLRRSVDLLEKATASHVLEEANTKAFAESSIQDFCSYHVKNGAGAEGGGTIRLQLDADGIAAAMLVSGDAKLKPLLDEAKSLRLLGAEPV